MLTINQNYIYYIVLLISFVTCAVLHSALLYADASGKDPLR